MNDGMPKRRQPHLRREKTRHGKMVWYVRRGDGARVRLRAAYGTQEFSDEYLAALTGEAAQAKRRVRSGSLQWLYEQYQDSSAWRSLSRATRRQRANILDGVMKTAGAEPFNAVTAKTIEAGKERRSDTPAQARNFLDAMRGMFRWALTAQHVKVDPTAGAKNPKRQKGGGFVVWSEADVERYETKWPVGTRQRVWLDVLLYTGLRRGDAVILGRQHVRAGVATLRTEKSAICWRKRHLRQQIAYLSTKKTASFRQRPEFMAAMKVLATASALPAASYRRAPGPWPAARHRWRPARR